MAPSPRIITDRYSEVVVRAAASEFEALKSLVFRRYPKHEWATFARVGWRESADRLIVTLAALDVPNAGELDDRVGHVAIQEPYTLRVALGAERHPLGVAVIHSHPKGMRPEPSLIDDDMDGYYAEYFGGFAVDRPYVSLIMSQMGADIIVSGRIYYKGAWVIVTRVVIENDPAVVAWSRGTGMRSPYISRARVARLASAFGDEAAARLRRSSVAVIGAGGTGSAAIETLVRAGVGRLVIVDPDHLEASNLERVHGSTPHDVLEATPKVVLAARHAQAIDPECQVEAYIGALPQHDVVDAVASVDLALGCTDQQHSRLALSDMTIRYLVPAIDCAVALEGSAGHMTGQIMQFTRFCVSDACILCRGMTDPTRLAQELMSDEERIQRRLAAQSARAHGEDGTAYWQEQPQLNTVGYLTTAAGAMAAGYAIGWLTGRFTPPFARLQMNWSAPYLDVTDSEQRVCPECVCQRARGWADQGVANAYITPPTHWPSVVKIF